MFFTPPFGNGSIFVNGADADLIIDNTLIDIKSSRNFKLERGDLNQIIGYHLLSIIGGINGKKTPRIKEIGIYFARYGYLWKLPLTYYHKLKDYKNLANEFILLIVDKDLSLVERNNVKRTTRLSQINSEYVIDKDDFKCPFCESKDFSRHGKLSSKKFRYKCKGCNKTYSTFIETTSMK